MSEKVEIFLEQYQYLWWKMAKYCFCMDVALDIIDEIDHYGCDFSGKQRAHKIFFCGNSDYFQFIWIGDHKYKKILDQLPIYEIDLSGGEGSLKCEGNFRTYMTNMIKTFIKEYNRNDKYLTMANNALIDLKIFSKNIIHENDYIPAIND